MSNYSKSEFTGSENTSWRKAFSFIPEGAKVLDVGCSSGNFGKALIVHKRCIVDGIELDKQDFLEAKKKLRNVYNLNIETDDLSRIREKYDVIYLGDVIEHLIDPVTALKKSKELLNKSGSIIFSIPNMAHITIRLLLLKGDFEYTESGLLDKTHIHFYNLKEIKRVFAGAGMKIEKLDYVEKDYPDTLIREWLNKVGLSPRRSFFAMMRQPEAAAFQFIGIAKPGIVKESRLKQFGPIDLFESYHNGVVKDLRDQIRSLQESNDILAADAERWRSFKKEPLRTILSRITRLH